MPHIHIGVNETAVKEARLGISEILKSGAEQKTIRAALHTLRNLCNVNNTTISGCTFGDMHDVKEEGK